ncbi:hypothetical protein N9230_04110, partial [Akkermansiaceae bacterium]|nr:hypothetical protein [Akkermansiaceae bacterium]
MKNNTFFMKPKNRKVATLAATLITFGSLAGGANGALITFDGVSADTFPAAPYEESGFTITATTGFNAVLNGGVFSSNYFTYQGSTTTATIALTSGGAFNLESLDLGLGQSAVGVSVDITLMGNLFGGGSISTTFNNVSTVQNEVLVGWNNLASVTISGTDDPGIDNINASAVPEPSSALLAGLGVLGLV